MENYFIQLFDWLTVLKKAFNSAQENPLLLPKYWESVRSVADKNFEYILKVIVSGCTFPEQPINISLTNKSFINFGTNALLLKSELLGTNIIKESAVDLENTSLSEKENKRFEKKLAELAKLICYEQSVVKIYNLEGWLQEIYRDYMGIDYVEQLQKKIDSLNLELESIPKVLKATGVNEQIVTEVMNAFKLFKTITGSAHMLEREKMSFTDRRNYVAVVQRIEDTIKKAENKLGIANTAQSSIRDVFMSWRDTNYKIMKLSRELKTRWEGTKLDERIQDLARLINELNKTVLRANEENIDSQAQLPITSLDDEISLAYQQIKEDFNTLVMGNIVMQNFSPELCREIRKFGNICLVIVPGRGKAKYSFELKNINNLEEDDKEEVKVNNSQNEEDEFIRRVRYSKNVIIVPVLSDSKNLLVDLANAWLEYIENIFPKQYAIFLQEVKSNIVVAFNQNNSQDSSKYTVRQILANLLADWLNWFSLGKESEDKSSGASIAFREWAVKKIQPAELVIPLRYQSHLNIFKEAGHEKQNSIWKEILGERYILDRQLVALNILQKNWVELKNNLKYLPQIVTNNRNVSSAFGKLKEKDFLAENNAAYLFKKFMLEDKDLKIALSSIESKVSIDVSTILSQATSPDKSMNYEVASRAIINQHIIITKQKIEKINQKLDLNLVALLYAFDKNYTAAISTLSMCLLPKEKITLENIEAEFADEALGMEKFVKLLARQNDIVLENRKNKDSYGFIIDDFYYYNLGVLYYKLSDYAIAAMCFREFKKQAEEKNKYYLYRKYSEEFISVAKEKKSSKNL